MQVEFFSPLVVQVIDGPTREFSLYEDFVVIINGRSKVIKKGFITDFASVPQVFQNVVENDDPHITKAAVLHDFLYRNVGFCFVGEKPFTRQECDAILYAGMLRLGASWWERTVVYYALRMFGASNFTMAKSYNRMDYRRLPTSQVIIVK